MKRIITLMILFFLSKNLVAQRIVSLKEGYQTINSTVFNPVYYKDSYNYFTPFIGTWKYVNGNNTFILTFWKDTKHPFYKTGEDMPNEYYDILMGHYKMIQNYGQSNQVILYTSETNIYNTITPWPNVIYGDALKQNQMSGIIYDITVATDFYKTGLRGEVLMTINPSTNPPTAQWTLSKSIEGDIYFGNLNFGIPTNITLTKM